MPAIKKWQFAVLFLVFIASATTLFFAIAQPLQAAQTVPYKVNFQGRLTDSAGAPMADGLYNMTFRLYNVSTGGTASWTEVRQDTNRVQVTNGLFSVQLGDVSALSPSLFTTQPLYFEIELPTPATATCSTNGCAVFNGSEIMSPRRALGASPYAMNSDTLDGIDSDSFARRDTNNTFSGTQVFRNGTNSTTAFQIQNAAGTTLLNANTTTNTIAVGTLEVDNVRFTGSISTNYVTPAGSNVGTRISIPVGNLSSFEQVLAVGLGVGSATTSRVISVFDARTDFTTQPAIGVFDPSEGSIGGLGWQGNTGMFQTKVIGTGAEYGVRINSIVPFILGVNGEAVFKNGTDSTSAFRIQNALASNTLLEVDTTNNNLKLGAATTLTLTGGTTVSRPASPTEGMIYFDVTTRQLLVYANGKWQADRSTATKIVAASNSSQAAKDAADYIADGEDSIGAGIGTLDGDQIEINQALTAASGGKVYLMEGTYTIDNSISVPNNTLLQGAGSGSIIQLGNMGATSVSIDAIINTDQVTGTGIGLKDLFMDGRRSINTAGTQHGVYLTNLGSGSGSTALKGANISGVTVKGFRSNGISFTTSFYNTVSNNTVLSNGSNGVSFSDSETNVISSNVVQGNNSYGIFLHSTSKNNSITGNSVQGNGNPGIALSSASENTITANSVSSNSNIGVYLSASSNNVISGNKLTDNGTSVHNNSVYLTNSDKNTITGNNVTDVSATSTNYAINILDGTSDGNYLSDNSLGGGTVNDIGTGTIYSGQIDGSGKLLNKSPAGSNFQTGTDVSDAFTIQNASTKTLLAADTITGTITVGELSGPSTYSINDSMTNSIKGNLSGDATHMNGQYVRLTRDVGAVSGAIDYYDEAVNTDFSAEFDFSVGPKNQGDGADAVFMYAYNVSVPASEEDALGGYIFYYSDYLNEIGIRYNGVKLTSVSHPNWADFSWREAKVIKSGNRLVMYMDGEKVIDYTDVTRTINAQHFGLGARTGGLSNEHRVRSLEVATDTASIQSELAVNGTMTIKTIVNSDDALAVKDSDGESVMSVSTLNNTVILGAGTTLSVTGGATGSRPANPTEGMIYFDTTTKQLLTYANGKWQADRSTSTKIVAASDSSQAAKDAADYVADGEAVTGAGTIDGDQVQINASLTAAAGGKVYLMEGTYTVDASILVPNNTTLQGAGNGTIVQIGDLDASIFMIRGADVTTGTGVVLRDMKLDGRNDLNTFGTQYGVYLEGMGGGNGVSATKGAIIDSLTVTRFINDGVHLEGSDNTILTNNTIQNNGVGVVLAASNNNLFTGNTLQGNTGSGYSMSTSYDNTFTGNLVQGNGTHGFSFSNENNTVTANTIQSNGADGISLASAANYQITGNTIANNTNAGISAQSTSTSSFNDNNIRGNGNYGINLSNGSNNTISGNTLRDNGGTTNNNSIYLSSTDINSITGNRTTDSSATTTNFSINIINSTSDSNYLADNTLGSGTINDIGTGTIFANQLNGTGQAANSSLGGAVFKLQTGSTADIMQAQDSAGGSLFRVSSTGAATFKNNTNSIAAFQVQRADSTLLFLADTTNSRIYVGPVAGNTIGALLVLGNKTNAGDPAGVNGGMYYNSTSKKMRCYVGSAWQDCLTAMTARKTADQSNSTTTIASVTDIAFPVLANTDYEYTCTIVYQTAVTTTGIKIAWTGPASPVSLAGAFVTQTTNAGAMGGSTTRAYDTTVPVNGTASVDTASVDAVGDFRGIFRNGSNTGTLTMRMASEVGGNSATIRAGSYCKLMPIN